MLLLGATPLDFIGRDRDLPNCSSRTFAGFASAKAFQLIFTRTRGMAMCPALRPCVQPSQRQLVREILSGWRQLSRSVDQELSFGCGWRLSLEVATKYAEGLLAIKYRTKDDNGAVAGGPMHYILLGMGEKWRPLAIFLPSQVS